MVNEQRATISLRKEGGALVIIYNTEGAIMIVTIAKPQAKFDRSFLVYTLEISEILTLQPNTL